MAVNAYDASSNNIGLTKNLIIKNDDPTKYFDDGKAKSILNSELSKIYDLRDINWDKCEIRALGNTTKEICEFYSYVSKDIKTISQRFKKGHNAIVRHLKAGNEYGWCVPPYDTSDKKVILSKGSTTQIFESANYVSKNSYEILGIDSIDASYIRYLCKNNKTKNGYLFSYAS